MIDSMQAAYVRVLRKIKTKGDGESDKVKEIVRAGVEKLFSKYLDHAGISEAARKLYSTAIKTYKIPNIYIAEIAKEGAALLFENFGKDACKNIYLIYTSAILQYFNLEEETLAKSLGDDASAFFKDVVCEDQILKLEEFMKDPKSKSDIKMF